MSGGEVVRRVPPAAGVLPQRFFYGWYIALSCALLMFVAAGVGYYGLAVFLEPLQEVHGWSTSAVSFATGLYFSFSGITAAVMGPRIDRNGPRKYILFGVVLIGTSVGLVGHVEALWHLYAVYILLAVGFGMSQGVAVNSIMTRWFVHRRAKAMSISSTGVSLGGVVIAPLNAWLIDIGGLELATPILGALLLLVAVPVVTLVLAADPREMGLQPDGEGFVPPAHRRRAQLSEASQLRRWTLREAARTSSFWAVLVGFLMVLTAQTGFVIHQISFLEDRLGSTSAAAFALSVTALGSIIARLIVGQFADALDKRWLTVALLAIQGTAVLVIIPIEGVAATYLLTLVFGFTIGNVYMMQSLLVSEIFGMVSFGAVFGVVSLASQVGSGVGPAVVGALVDATGGYAVPFTITAIVTYAAAGVVLLARPLPAPAAAPGATVDEVATTAGRAAR